MNKGMVLFMVVLLVAVFALGVVLAGPFEPGPVIAAHATTEAAKADAERARASEAWAQAREADTAADAVRGSLDQMKFGVQVLAVGLPSVVVLLAVALAFCAVRLAWARGQANVFYPKAGVNPVLALERHGALVVLDTARNLGGLAVVGADGKVRMPLAGSEELHAQLAAQSLAANVIAAAAGEQERASTAAAVGRAVQDALGALPTLTTASTRPAGPVIVEQKHDGGELRIIRRNTPKASTPGTVKRGHFAEFVKRGSVIGFGRREWAGEVFTDGTHVSQTLWAALSKAARDADILTEDGGRWKLRASAEATLCALGLEEFASGGEA